MIICGLSSGVQTMAVVWPFDFSSFGPRDLHPPWRHFIFRPVFSARAALHLHVHYIIMPLISCARNACVQLARCVLQRAF